MRRVISSEKKINEIDKINDKRIRLTGTVLNVFDNSIILDDGSGSIEIKSNTDISHIKNGQLVKAICRLYGQDDNFTCFAEAIQVLNNLNIQLYRKVNKLIKG